MSKYSIDCPARLTKELVNLYSYELKEELNPEEIKFFADYTSSLARDYKIICNYDENIPLTEDEKKELISYIDERRKAYYDNGFPYNRNLDKIYNCLKSKDFKKFEGKYVTILYLGSKYYAHIYHVTYSPTNHDSEEYIAFECDYTNADYNPEWEDTPPEISYNEYFKFEYSKVSVSEITKEAWKEKLKENKKYFDNFYNDLIERTEKEEENKKEED